MGRSKSKGGTNATAEGMGQFAQISGKSGDVTWSAGAFAQPFCWREDCS
jgi:hypothetical protein